MKQYTVEDVKKVLFRIGGIGITKKDLLTELDSKLGDGDMGISMSRGAEAIRHELEAFDKTERDITKLLMACGVAFNRAAPSTLGTLLSFGVMAIAKEVNHSESVSEEKAAAFPLILANTIAARGKANVGDKTILDALFPYANVLVETYQETKNLEAALVKASKAAEAGMESTKGIKAKTGRASWLDTRNMEYPDAGAILCVLVSKELAGTD